MWIILKSDRYIVSPKYLLTLLSLSFIIGGWIPREQRLWDRNLGRVPLTRSTWQSTPGMRVALRRGRSWTVMQLSPSPKGEVGRALSFEDFVPLLTPPPYPLWGMLAASFPDRCDTEAAQFLGWDLAVSHWQTWLWVWGLQSWRGDVDGSQQPPHMSSYGTHLRENSTQRHWAVVSASQALCCPLYGFQL